MFYGCFMFYVCAEDVQKVGERFRFRVYPLIADRGARFTLVEQGSPTHCALALSE